MAVLEAALPGRVRYIDAATIANARADRHLVRKVFSYQAPDKRDCLHYCLPGPSDAWALALYNLLLNNRRYARQGEEG